jgi:hypothetical protein
MMIMNNVVVQKTADLLGIDVTELMAQDEEDTNGVVVEHNNNNSKKDSKFGGLYDSRLGHNNNNLATSGEALGYENRLFQSATGTRNEDSSTASFSQIMNQTSRDRLLQEQQRQAREQQQQQQQQQAKKSQQQEVVILTGQDAEDAALDEDVFGVDDMMM